MGGKTQQRVAGNSKPASSGRIRELLTNQQSATGSTGKIITFSALSNKIPVIQKQATPKKNDKEIGSESDNQGPVTNVEKQPETSVEKTITPPTPTKENYRLVVKRVGNRDLYTRVKVSDHSKLNDGSIMEPDVLPSEAGVKKPAYLTGESTTQDLAAKSEDLAVDEEEDEEDDESEIETGDEIEGDFDELLERLSQLRDSSHSAPTIDSLSETSEKQLEKESDLLDILKTLVKRFSHDLSIEEWDLLVNSLHKWTNWISKSEHPLIESYQSDFGARVFRFIHYLICFADDLKTKGAEKSDEFPMMQSLLDDWANFQSSNMFQELLILYFRLISIHTDNASGDIVRSMIEALTHIIVGVDPKIVLSHSSLLDNLSPKVEPDLEFKEPKNSIYCNMDEKKFKSLLAVCGLLRSNIRVILVSAHAMLSKSLTSVCENAIQAVIPTQDQEQIIDEEIPIFPPVALMSILTSRDVIMSALLSDYRVGDTSVTIEHNTDAYSCTLSYLFAWDLVIQFIVGVDKEIGHKMIHSLKKLGLIQRLLDNIFMLLPPLGQQDTLRFRIYKSTASDRNQRQLSTSVGQQWNLDSFLKNPLRTTVKRPLNEIELIALHIYFSVALHMPVTVRKWYNNNSNKRLCNLVNEYTVKHVSKVICSLEMESVQEKCVERATQVESTNLTIRARSSAKEVYAIYHRDEFQMELTIKLPLNYPLGPVQIDGGKRVGVTDVKWRSWLLQLTTFLAHQNGPILDGIDLWRKNIDKRFEGVEKCTICFSILHSNYQLPKKKCQTCSNVFHNLCLFKWFESSGNSTCPLCRNPW